MRMLGGVLVVCGVFGVLAGCIPTSFEARPPWRHEAEEKCLSAGGVKETPSVVLVKPIDGPGMCGADFPLKVSALGESAIQTGALGYADDLRPPGSVPQGSQFPPQPSYARPAPAQPAYQPYSPPPAASQTYSRGYESSGQQPISLTPNGQQRAYGEPQAAYQGAQSRAPQSQYRPPQINQTMGDSRDPLLSREPIGEDASYLGRNAQQRGAPPAQANTQNGDYEDYPQDDREDGRPPAAAPALPRLSPSVIPMGRPRVPAATTVAVSPVATLACPVVSALDRWIIDAVQPAAQRWFNSAVTEIRQISAYSCRGMNGQPGAHISEHAFGNALDIAAFVLADGRKITVEKGWKGTVEEQAFLHDVQLAACDQFTTVLAPGSNVYHYNHIHVDLMRRASGRRICQPRALSGEEVAMRLRGKNGPMFAERQEPPRDNVLASGPRQRQIIERDNDPFAWRPGNGAARDTTGSISSKDSSALRKVIDDEEFLGDDGDPEEHHNAPPRISAPEVVAPKNGSSQGSMLRQFRAMVSPAARDVNAPQ